jgi:hypothetical protein
MNDELKTPINLTLPLGAVNMVMAALGKAPYEQVAELVQSIREQAIPQIPMPEMKDAPAPESVQ